MQYNVVVQAGPDEILGVTSPSELNLEQLSSHESIDDFIVALPDITNSDQAASKLKAWGYKFLVGDAYNICQRMLDAQALLKSQDFIVRILAVWRHVDLEYVDSLVSEIQTSQRDLVIAPKDYDCTMAADVASIKAIKKLSQLTPQNAQHKRALFNPWSYMECHPDVFDVCLLEPAPKYSEAMIEKILNDRRQHPEREFFGNGYEGSRYHFLGPKLRHGMKILDIACGSGFGSAMLSETADYVLGVDYDASAIELAKQRFGQSSRLEYRQADAQVFRYELPEYFDCVVSFHTLEHVPDDYAMIKNLCANLKTGGRLIIEVPLLAARPLGVPINPYHLREYSFQQVENLVINTGVAIEKIYGVCRGMYVDKALARDAIQIWAIKG